MRNIAYVTVNKTLRVWSSSDDEPTKDATYLFPTNR